MKVVILEPGRYARIADIEYTPNPLDLLNVEYSDEAIKEIVGDTPAVLLSRSLPWDDDIALIYNDRFLLDGSMPNRTVGETIMCGTFIICGFEGDDYASLSEEQAERYFKELYEPECFVPFDGCLYVNKCTPEAYQAFYWKELEKGFYEGVINREGFRGYSR